MTDKREFKIGEIVNGYQYLGGEDTDPLHWKKVEPIGQSKPNEKAESSVLNDFLLGLERGGWETTGGGIGVLLGAPVVPPWGALGGGMLGTMIGSEAGKLLQRLRGVPNVPGHEQTIMAGLEAPVLGRMGELAGAGFRYALHPKAMSEAIPRLNMMSAYGLPPLAPAATGSKLQQMMWEASTNVPGGIGIGEKWTKDFNQGMQSNLARLTPQRLGSITAADELLKKAAATSVNKFFDRANYFRNEYNRILREYRPKTSKVTGRPTGTAGPPMVDLTNYIQSLRGPMYKYGEAQAKAYSSPKFMQRLAALEKEHGIKDAEGNLVGLEPVSWAEADAIRQSVGEDIGKARKLGSFQEMDFGTLKHNYSSITKDMEKAINKRPKAKRYWNLHKKFFRRGADIIEKDVDKLTAAEPKKFFMDVAKGDYKDAESVWRAIPTDVRNVVKDEAVWRLGLTTPGQEGAELGENFSVSTFLTNYNKMMRDSPKEMKRLLFGTNPAKGKEVEDLVQIANWVKDLQKVANTSRTAFFNNIISMSDKWGSLGALGLLYIDPSSTLGHLALGGTLGARTSANLMTKPSFVRWLAKGKEFNPIQPGMGKLAVAHHIAKLGGLTGLNSEERKLSKNLRDWLFKITENPDLTVAQAMQPVRPLKQP